MMNFMVKKKVYVFLVSQLITEAKNAGSLLEANLVKNNHLGS